MNRLLLAGLPLLAIAFVTRAHGSDLIDLYKHLHTNPELSFMEEKTSRRMADEFRLAGLDVTEKVGGWGVVGVYSNGPGPTLMIRADMDGLPIKEATG